MPSRQPNPPQHNASGPHGNPSPAQGKVFNAQMPASSITPLGQSQFPSKQE